MNQEAREMYRQAIECFETDHEKSVGLLREASMAGSLQARALYAKVLHFDDRYKDDRAAFMYFLDTAERGNLESQYYVGMFYLEGDFVEKDYRNAAQWFRISAEQGEAKSQFQLGYLYKNGFGVYKDYSQASRWFTLSLERGNMEANYELAQLYGDEKGKMYDPQKSREHYEAASHADVKDAHFFAGLCHFKGIGTPKNYITAASYFRRGVDVGDLRCMYLLGLMYHKGWGVQADRVFAIKTLSDAAMYGSKEARTYLDTGEIKDVGGEKIEVDDDDFNLECNTPDIIAKVEGVEKKGGFFSFLRR